MSDMFIAGKRSEREKERVSTWSIAIFLSEFIGYLREGTNAELAHYPPTHHRDRHHCHRAVAAIECSRPGVLECLIIRQKGELTRGSGGRVDFVL